MLHGRWAFQCRRQLDADPELCDVPVIASRRELMVVGDSIDNTKHAERMLQGLLERNPRNRMAFEYLMAHYLLTRQPAKLAANLSRFDELGYPRVPRHCQEAVLIHLQTSGSSEIDLVQWKISSETWRRNGQFVRALRRFSMDNAAEAYASLHGEFGNN